MAMKVWDWEMRELYRVMGDLDLVCRTVEGMGGGAGRRRHGDRVRAGPVLGVNVEVSALFLPENVPNSQRRYPSVKKVGPSNQR